MPTMSNKKGDHPGNPPIWGRKGSNQLVMGGLANLWQVGMILFGISCMKTTWWLQCILVGTMGKLSFGYVLNRVCIEWGYGLNEYLSLSHLTYQLAAQACLPFSLLTSLLSFFLGCLLPFSSKIGFKKRIQDTTQIHVRGLLILIRSFKYKK